MCMTRRIFAQATKKVMMLAGLVALSSHMAAATVSSIDVTYRNGELNLAAELLLPESSEPLPTAIIVQGSGSSDRRNRWSRDIADALLSAGVAVLLTDKRGSGASQGSWQTASFDDLAADALAGVAYLRSRDDVDSERIGIVGLSQGGQVVAVAAARSEQIAFVVNVSGKAVSFAEGSFIEMANTARQAGLDKAHVSEVLALNREAALYAGGGAWQQYAQARADALKTPIRDIAEGFPADADAPIWGFLRSAVYFDPLAYWTLVRQPVFVVYGEADEKDNVPVAESVRRLQHAFAAAEKSNFEILVVPHASHGIRDPETHRLAPLFLERLKAWLEENIL